MSQDGKLQAIIRVINNDRPIDCDVACECGGTFYASPGARYATCTGGEVRCTTCRRPARRFGKGYTCGVGCCAHE